MAENMIGNDVKSFVSFALAMKPTVPIATDENSDVVELQFNTNKKLSEREITSIEDLVAKYEKIKKLLPSGQSLDTMQLHETKPRVSFEPGTNYQIVSIQAEQLSLAKDIAGRVERIYSASQSGKHDEARDMYDELQSFLDEKRTTFLGDFLNVPEIDAVIGTHAVGRNGDPQALGGGAIIFVIIEIYVS